MQTQNRLHLKALASALLLVGSVSASAATIVLYDFQDLLDPDGPGMFPPLSVYTTAPETVAANLTASNWGETDGTLAPFLRNPADAPASWNWAASATSWFTSTPSLGNDFHFTITVDSGFSLDITGFSFQEAPFSTGGAPTGWTLLLNGSPIAAGSVDSGFDGLEPSGSLFLSGLTGVLNFALVATGAANDVAAWRVDNFKLEGDVVPVPVAPAVWLLGGSLFALAGIARRKPEVHASAS